jgi:hypothetical protein
MRELGVKVADILIINMCFNCVRHFGLDFAWGVEFIAIYLHMMTLLFFFLGWRQRAKATHFPFN